MIPLGTEIFLKIQSTAVVLLIQNLKKVLKWSSLKERLRAAFLFNLTL